ncbi:MAG: hypothetical protein ACRCYY_01565 [Trueperaceae bacterium]
MDEFLRLHQPSKEARLRALQANVDLETLKETDPSQYKMFAAQRLLDVSPGLEPLASSTLFAAFKHHEIFKLEGLYTITLLIFPELSEKELERLDNALSKFITTPSHKTTSAYFRIVTDKNGEHRQLALPLRPEAWQGQTNILIGPFQNEVEANAWGNETVRTHNLLHDAIPHAGTWFCDVFVAE